jgi:CRISPR/Cas system-associated exonuclease Cas4 (RecB family)
VWDETIKDTIGIEIKTGYGYQFEKEVIGKPSKKGSPKYDHLMQVMLYLNYFKTTPLFKMVYIDRGNVARVEYNITLNKSTGAAIVDGRDFNKELTIPNILSRYNLLGKCLEDDTLPRRDYQLQYTDEKIRILYESNRLTKSDAKEYESKKKINIGDWRCSYCDYKDYCWKEKKDV